MGSQITVRLDDRLASALNTAAEKTGFRRSDIVRFALARFLEERSEPEESPLFSRVRDLLGSVESGVPDLGEAHREHLERRFRRRG
ncbi:ribbon-helix-helix domain-containing protein [Deferrisoma camini]|uniref:ribbon-helix-helix domain-containing protein n=1 Tax=Deferrisoma camini TaxID=1035120 RepID=UPI00046D0299